jgi:adenylylsulfate kinase
MIMNPERMNNIFPSNEKMVQRSEKEERLNQTARVIWFTGLSGSGKTTLATALEQRLFNKGFLTQVLDGDNIRAGINNNLGFSPDDRTENIRRIAEISKLFTHCGVITICALVSPTPELRAIVKSILDTDDYIEIFVNTPLKVCEERDTKGLYAKARSGQISQFTGIDAPYNPPVHPFLSIDTTNKTVEECVDYIEKNILPLIKFKK